MAGGIDWFRWHHGAVTDPKFQLIAKKASVRLGDVLVVWCFVLENASANAERGTIGQLDFETLDFLLGMEDGTAARIHDAMAQRGLIEGNRIARWDARQPKRERDPGQPAPDATPPKTSTERSREHRANKAQCQPDDAMQRHATPCNATGRQATPRGEESKEEKEIDPPTPTGVAPPPASPRGTRKCPKAFAVTPDLITWAASEAPGVPLDKETAKMRDHTFKNTISDWEGAWRNWMRRAQKDADERRADGKGQAAKTFAERNTDVKRAQVAAWSGGLLGKDPNTIDMEQEHGPADLLG